MGWVVIAIKALLFVIAVKSYRMLWVKTHQFQSMVRTMESVGSVITKRLQDLDQQPRDGSLEYCPLFHGSFGWSLTSVEVILLLDLSSPGWLPLLRRYSCAGCTARL